MAKETYYFSHDYNARNDPKLLKVHKDMGLEGLGLYWCLIEMLYEQDGTLIMSDIDDYAFALRTDAKNIHDLIDNYKLFRKNQKYFYSDSINIRLKKRKEKSKKRQDAAISRWSKDANALQTESKCNAIKGKERKGKEINIHTQGADKNLIYNSYGKEFQLVKLTEQEYNKFVCTCLNKELADEIIDELDLKLSSGLEQDITNHYARLLSYFKYRNKNKKGGFNSGSRETGFNKHSGNNAKNVGSDFFKNSL